MIPDQRASAYYPMIYTLTKGHSELTLVRSDDCRRPDGVHPTYPGHQLMAEEWICAVQAFRPERVTDR